MLFLWVLFYNDDVNFVVSLVKSLSLCVKSFILWVILYGLFSSVLIFYEYFIGETAMTNNFPLSQVFRTDLLLLRYAQIFVLLIPFFIVSLPFMYPFSSLPSLRDFFLRVLTNSLFICLLFLTYYKDILPTIRDFSLMGYKMNLPTYFIDINSLSQIYDFDFSQVIYDKISPLMAFLARPGHFILLLLCLSGLQGLAMFFQVRCRSAQETLPFNLTFLLLVNALAYLYLYFNFHP